jgi:multiple sugar transport system ATP-binding protein
VTLGVRPEHLQVGPGATHDNRLQAKVGFIDRLGGSCFVYFDFPGAESSLTAELRGDSPLHGGQIVTLSASAQACYLFDAQGKAFARHLPLRQQHAA